MLILIGKGKGYNGHSWDSPRIDRASFRKCPDDAEVSQPRPLFLFIYSFLQQAVIKQLLRVRYFVRYG